MTNKLANPAHQQRATEQLCTIVVIDTPHQTIEVVFALDGKVHVSADVLQSLAVYHPCKKKRGKS